MRIKDWEYSNFAKDIKDVCSLLIFGPDRGLVKDRSDFFLVEQKKSLQNSLEIFKLTPEDFAKSESVLFELAYQKPIFHKKTLIHINLDLIKNLKIIVDFLENIDEKKTNFLLLESSNLKSDSLIVKLFKKTNNLAYLTCYNDNSKSLFNFIKSYCDELGLKISNENIQLLGNKLGNDRLITKREIEKLALHADNTSITYEDILIGVGDNTTIKLDLITDCLLIKSSSYINKIIDKVLEDGINYLLIIRSITKHLQLLLKLQLLSIKNVKEIVPPVHFSRHQNIQLQLSKIALKRIKTSIFNINKLEIACKKQPALAGIFIKYFVFKLCSIKS